METFNAKIYRPELIVLNSSKDLAKLYNLIMKDEDFLIEWTDELKKQHHAEVIVATHIAGKVKNGEMKLKAEE